MNVQNSVYCGNIPHSISQEMIDCGKCTQQVGCPLYPEPSLHNTALTADELDFLVQHIDGYNYCSLYVCDAFGLRAAVEVLKDHLRGVATPTQKIHFHSESIEVLSFGTDEKPAGEWGRFVEAAYPHRLFARDPRVTESEVWMELSPRTSKFLRLRLYAQREK